MSTGGDMVKERLVEEIDRLPAEKLQEVLDFVGYLLSKGQKEAAEPQRDLDPTKDPLLKFIAGASHGSLTKDIDNELYGK